MKKTFDKKLSYKIVLLGDIGSNKTIFLKKLKNNKYDEKYKSTIGIDKISFYININTQDKGEIDVDLCLFDLPSQEKFFSILISYIKDAKGIILMYDITRYDSSKSLESLVDFIKDNIGNKKDYLLILLGDKLELVKENENKREITAEEALSFCEKYNIFWGGEIDSLMNSNEEIQNKFKLIVEEIYKKVGNNNKIKINKNNNTKNKKKENCA